MATTNANKPCLRIVFIRYPQFECHATEVRDGVPAVRSNAEDALTELGVEMLHGIKVNLSRFIHGREPVGTGIPILEPLYYTDTRVRSVATLHKYVSIGGCGIERCKEAVLGYMPIPDDAIQPIVMFCSSETIRSHLAEVIGERMYECFGPPLASATMIDHFSDGSAFVHTVANTTLYPDVCWWCNASE